MNRSAAAITLVLEKPTKPLERPLPVPAQRNWDSPAATAPPSLVAIFIAPRKGGSGGNLGNCGRNDLFIGEGREARRIAEKAA